MGGRLTYSGLVTGGDMWQDVRQEFIEATSVELDMLGRALPLMPLRAAGDVRIRVDQGRVHVAMSAEPLRVSVNLGLSDVLGPSAEGCVELLGVRPLLFGTAWKVLDLFMDALMVDNHEPPDRSNGYTIAAKVSAAQAGRLTQRVLTPDIWDAMRQVYAGTFELRHSLVHRRVTLNSEGTLIGHDRQGKVLPQTLSLHEQEALARAAQRLGEAAAQGPPMTARTQLDLAAWLARLSVLHSVQFGEAEPMDTIRELTWVAYPHPDTGTYPTPIDDLWKLPNLQGQSAVDLVVQFADQPGIVARGHLEDAPRELLELDPRALPAWLTR